jgi:hypothetical protein
VSAGKSQSLRCPPSAQYLVIEPSLCVFVCVFVSLSLCLSFFLSLSFCSSLSPAPPHTVQLTHTSVAHSCSLQYALWFSHGPSLMQFFFNSPLLPSLCPSGGSLTLGLVFCRTFQELQHIKDLWHSPPSGFSPVSKPLTTD